MDLYTQVLGLLGRFIQIKEPNFRYLGMLRRVRVCSNPNSWLVGPALPVVCCMITRCWRELPLMLH